MLPNPVKKFLLLNSSNLKQTFKCSPCKNYLIKALSSSANTIPINLFPTVISKKRKSHNSNLSAIFINKMQNKSETNAKQKKSQTILFNARDDVQVIILKSEIHKMSQLRAIKTGTEEKKEKCKTFPQPDNSLNDREKLACLLKLLKTSG